MDNLPEELKVVIFHKLPIKNVGFCMFVCKRWLSLIKSHSFVSSYTLANKNIPSNQLLVFQQSFKILEFHFDNEGFYPYKRLKVPFDAEDLHLFVKGICNGVLCITDIKGSIVLWNPAIQKTLTLPCLEPGLNKVRWLYPGLGFDSSTNDYKVVSLLTFNIPQEIPYKVHIFSLNRNSWRNDVAVAPEYNVVGESLYFNQVIHWTGQNDKDCVIMGFDVSTEVFRVMKLPDDVDKANRIAISVYKESTIGFCHYNWFNAKHIDVWVMKEYGNVESWTKIWRWNGEQQPASHIEVPSPLGFRMNGDLFLQVPRHTDLYRPWQLSPEVIISFDIETGEEKVVATRHRHWRFSYHDTLRYFVRSLVLLDHPDAESYDINTVDLISSSSSDSSDSDDELSESEAMSG